MFLALHLHHQTRSNNNLTTYDYEDNKQCLHQRD